MEQWLCDEELYNINVLQVCINTENNMWPLFLEKNDCFESMFKTQRVQPVWVAVRWFPYLGNK